MEQQGIGALLRNQRAATGRSQADQAEVLSEISGQPVTRNEVSRWECERRLPTPFWQKHMAATFEIDVQGIRRAVMATRAEQRKAKTGETVQRREFIGAMAALAIPPARTEQPTARRIGQSDIDELRRRTARLRRLDNVLGGAETFPVYSAEVDFTQRLLRESSHTIELGQQLRALLAEQQQQAGWAAFDHGQNALAQRLYSDSRKAAEEAGALDLAGNALAYAAYQQTATAQSGTALAADSCEVEQAAATLARAADLAAGVSSVRPAARIQAVARQLAGYRSTPMVGDLLARLGA
ncbi:hypothetical protein [Amycolatopsis balhimycina]|uniref:hypothetical protein n=1 Tax=Amycolatopsis balhimycina TaxID=208443 RepID=UPI0003A401B6|nr:hypothetical protein [Amycolatopsis balhimycina]